MTLIINGTLTSVGIAPVAGQSGKFLSTNGVITQWSTPGAVVGVTGPASPVTGHMWLDNSP